MSLGLGDLYKIKDDGKPNSKAGGDKFGVYRMVLDGAGAGAGQGEPSGTPVLAPEVPEGSPCPVLLVRGWIKQRNLLSAPGSDQLQLPAGYYSGRAKPRNATNNFLPPGAHSVVPVRHCVR